MISPLEYTLFGYQFLRLLSAAVSAMPKPKKEGWYSFWYRFLHAETNNLDSWFETKSGMPMPRTVEADPLDPKP